MLTFPIRLLTCIPRLISNGKQTENLLHKYLIDEGVDKKLLESDHVHVRLEWEKPSQFPTSMRRTKDGTIIATHAKEKCWLEENVNFIEVPTYEGSDHSSSGMKC